MDIRERVAWVDDSPRIGSARDAQLIIDATTPIAPEHRGHYGQPVTDPAGTADWIARLGGMRVGR
jgi:hypothetical protein